MTDDKGKIVKETLPGMPVIVTGWKDVPVAGDEILQAPNGEEEAKKAIANRQRDAERKALLADVEKINEKRRLERERIEHEEAIAEAAKAEGTDPVAAAAAAHRQTEATEKANAFKELRLVIRADVSGTVEAVVGALEHIGNKEAGVKIIHAGVGDVAESDVAIAEAAEGKQEHLWNRVCAHDPFQV
jgi:translation initiation factor IF-2